MPSIGKARQLIPNQEEFIKEGETKIVKWDPWYYKVSKETFEVPLSSL